MELKGKPLSLGAKILGALIAVAGLALKATIAPDMPIDAVLKVAGFVVVIFASVDVSLWLEKIFKVKGGDSEYPDSGSRSDNRRIGAGYSAEKLQPREGGN